MYKFPKSVYAPDNLRRRLVRVDVILFAFELFGFRIAKANAAHRHRQ